jgi:HlyD family secretion protein
MRRLTRRQAILATAGVLVLAAVVYAFLPDPVPVETVTVSRGPLQVVVEEEGETRMEDRYVITAPVAAYLRRIELDVGDPVQAGQPVVQLEPPRSAILDPRTRVEATARLDRARATLAQAEIAAENAVRDLGRMQELAAAGAVSPQALEHATADAARALAARDVARSELAAAQDALRTPGGTPRLQVQETLRAPAAGRVLAVHRESEGHVMPGEPLVEVGNTERLRVFSDVLSQDAVRIHTGTRVLLDQWGGDVPLQAVVTRVEPEGFLRISALGVQERRVRVVADMTSPPQAAAGLGPGYRVLARFVVWDEADVLQVPTAALFRQGDSWAVFVVERGRARIRTVEVGREAGLRAQILAGLAAGEEVIVHPGNDVRDGARVRARGES